MTTTTHEIRLTSDRPLGKRLPPRSVGYLLAELPMAIQQSVSMALRNRSTSQGRRPTWLDRASDVRLVDLGSDGDQSVMYFEAPTLGEAAAELFQQRELWPTRPDERDTGFDLFGDVLADVTAKNSDSDHFDPQLLHRLMRFRRAFTGPFREIDFTSRRYAVGHAARLLPETIQTAESLYGSTPAARRVRLVGKLDMLRASTQTFEVQLDDQQIVRGVLADGGVDDVKDLLNRRVLVLGKAIYRASGRLLRIEADSISAGEKESNLWSRLPEAGTGRLDVTRLRKVQGPRSGMAAIMGQWPGQETDEEISKALEMLS